MTLEELWRAPGDDAAIISGTANHEPGDVRVSFLVVDAEGRVVTLPTARVWVADGLDSVPFLESSAKLERIGVPGGAVADASHIYVARLKLDRPGKYWLLAEPEGGATKVQALGNVVVVKKDPLPTSATLPSRRTIPRFPQREATSRSSPRARHPTRRFSCTRLRTRSGRGAVRRHVLDPALPSRTCVL
jgi:hypothetical protein